MVHKLTRLRDKRSPVGVVMLCKPKETGKNQEPKSINSNHVTCLRCLAFIANGFEQRYAESGWKVK